MIDWCVDCADVGCIFTKHRDKSHRDFAFMFIRTMKDALSVSIESEFFERETAKDGGWSDTFILHENFYKTFIESAIIGWIIGKRWFKKSYWAFMKHMIDDAWPNMKYWSDYKMKVEIDKDGCVRFKFIKK